MKFEPLRDVLFLSVIITQLSKVETIMQFFFLLTGHTSPVVQEGHLMSKSLLNGTRKRKTSKWQTQKPSSLSSGQMWEVPRLLPDLTTDLCDPSVTRAMLRPQSVQENWGWIHPGCWKCSSSEGAASATSDLYTSPVLSTLHQRRTGRLVLVLCRLQVKLSCPSLWMSTEKVSQLKM